jgi:hypothetical protein
MLSAMCSTIPRRLMVIGALAAIVVPLDARREQGGTSGPAPWSFTFRALGENGAPVADLRAADVTLKLDGRPKEVRSLQFVRFGDSSATGSARAALPPPFATNVAPTDRRDVFLLVDEESFTTGREDPLRAAAGAVIAGLPPTDRVSLISLRQGGINLPLTTDHARVRDNLSGIRGQAPGRETPADLTCRTLRLLGTLETVFKSVGGRAPATMLLFSAAAAAMPPSQTARIGGETGSGLCQLRLDHFRQLTNAALASQSDLYVVELMEVGGSQALPEASGGLENIAGASGGEFTRLTGNGEAQMARIVRETSGYYVATFDPDPTERPEVARRIEVSVARPNVTVRARSAFSASRAGTRKQPNPRDMIRTAESYADLPLRASSFSTRNVGDGKIKLVTLFESLEPSSKLTAAMIGVYDDKGSLKAQWTAQSSDLARSTVMAALAVAPGKYRLRVAATDAAGRSGTVDSDLTAALIVAGSISLSDMAFGTTDQSGMTPVIQFGSQSAATAFLELYGRPTAPLGAKIEIADTPDGPALNAVPVAAAASSEPDRFTLTGTFPLDSLKPGDYIVRAIIGVQGEPQGQVVRTLRKVGS